MTHLLSLLPSLHQDINNTISSRTLFDPTFRRLHLRSNLFSLRSKSASPTTLQSNSQASPPDLPQPRRTGSNFFSSLLHKSVDYYRKHDTSWEAEMEKGNNEIPEDANEHCPGPQSEDAGKSDACAGCPNQEVCATAPKGPDPDLVAIAERMATVKHKILVLSGKGGVGKSTFSAQLSFALASMDYQVGLLDVDICGPSIPKMLGLEGQDIHQSNLGWSPVYVESNLGVMSIGFMLPHPDEAVIWRGPRKNGLIKQFLKDVYWGELDYLVVDAPPGTSDEHISIIQFLQATGIDGAIIVTTPQQVSLIDVRKEVSFCKKVGLEVLGVVENMSGLQQPLANCQFTKVTETGDDKDVTEWVMNYLKQNAPEMLNVVVCSEVFDSSLGGAAKMSMEMGVPFLGKVPMDPQLCKAAEEGRSCFTDQKSGPSAPALKRIIDKIVADHTRPENP